VLTQHAWPGNVRELQNVMERLVLTHPGRVVSPNELGIEPAAESGIASAGDAACVSSGPPRNPALPPFQTLREMERWLIVKTLARLEGNRTRTARQLGISLRTLRNKINEYSIDEPETRARLGSARSAPSEPPGNA